MRMKTEEMKLRRIRTGRKPGCWIAWMILLAALAGCSEKDTVLLDSEDMVKQEGTIEEGEKAAAPQEEGAEGKEEEAALSEEERKERVEESTLFVHICGEVARPGVYELPKGSRVYEAVEEAGGFTENAARDFVNLAYVLEDGWKIEIPSMENLENGEEGKAGGVSTGIFPEGLGEGLAAGGEAASDGLVDINSATKQELTALPGIGESRAESIISYREKNGGFSRIEDIMKVEGIKEGMFAKMKDKICVRGVR